MPSTRDAFAAFVADKLWEIGDSQTVSASELGIAAAAFDREVERLLRAGPQPGYTVHSALGAHLVGRRPWLSAQVTKNDGGDCLAFQRRLATG